LKASEKKAGATIACPACTLQFKVPSRIPYVVPTIVDDSAERQKPKWGLVPWGLGCAGVGVGLLCVALLALILLLGLVGLAVDEGPVSQRGNNSAPSSVKPELPQAGSSQPNGRPVRGSDELDNLLNQLGQRQADKQYWEGMMTELEKPMRQLETNKADAQRRGERDRYLTCCRALDQAHDTALTIAYKIRVAESDIRVLTNKIERAGGGIR
jgi:hypothetical protein